MANDEDVKMREEAIKQLRDCCQLIKTKAKESDMSDTTLLAHLQKTICEFKWKHNKAKKADTNSFGFLDFVLLLAKGVLYFFALLVLLYMAYNAACVISPKLERKSFQMIQKYNLVYKYLRIVRLVTLPLHQLINMKAMTPSECLINNPLYAKEPPACDTCENITSIERVPFNDADELDEAIQAYEPTVITGEPGYSDVEYDFAYLKDFYSANKNELDDSFVGKIGTSEIKTLEGFFALDEKKVMDSGLIFGWHASHLIGTKTLRQLYQRPSFLPIMAEVVIEKTLLIVSPGAKDSLLYPPSNAGQGLLVQASGMSEISLIRDPHCARNCTDLKINLQQGEILYYPPTPWEINIKAIGDKLSVFYGAGFTSA